jgi:uncharacterized metal-binding protein (TIGR02443 family)
MSKPLKRFIAGAICPRCAEMDKIVMYEVDEAQFRECVACGFQDKQGGEGSDNELPTRVNRAQPEAVKVEPVVFFRSSSDKDKD